jgi:serine/threonine-protein kinase
VDEAGPRDGRRPLTKVTVTFTILAVLVVIICFGAALLARRHLAQNRGDRRGALRLAAFYAWVLVALWLSKGHFTASFGTFAMFVVAMCTSVFYGVVIWTVYIALEPYARRRWPQTLISWSSIAIGKWRNPVVGRDVLIGACAGAAIPVIGGALELWLRTHGNWSPKTVNADMLAGSRAALAYCLNQVPHAVRETLFFFFLIFLLRVLLRNEWLAAAAFGLLMASSNFFNPSHAVLIGFVNFMVVFGFAFLVLRWGLLSLAVCILTSNLAGSAPLTGNATAWYFPYGFFMIAAVLAMAVWAFKTSVRQQPLWRVDLT